MASIIQGFEYDIFISYRQKDNKYDGWVTEFVDNLKRELDATFKEEVSVYFDINPHDGLLETHDVDASLKEKLKCLVFITIISRTYCDPKSFAWEHEFKPFLEQASRDQFGMKIKLPGGNVANRILPIQIHELDTEDKALIEKELGGVLRPIEFIYKEPGVNRPLTPEDEEKKNLNGTRYRNQINKTANVIKEVISGLKIGPPATAKVKIQHKKQQEEVYKEEKRIKKEKPFKFNKRTLFSGVAALIILIIAAVFVYPRVFKRDSLGNLRSSDGRISVAVMPFQNLTNDSIKNVWQDWIQNNLIASLSNSEELRVRQIQSINTLIQSKGLANYALITPSLASEISQKLNANVFIYGNIKQAGHTVRVNVQLIDSKTEEVFKSFQVEGPSKEEEIFQIIDSLSLKVKDFLVISKLKKEGPFNLWNMLSTTNSPEAYRYYISGKKAFEKRDYSTARNMLSQALVIDSNFYYANILLIYAYGNPGLYDQAKKLTLKLYGIKDRMSMPQKIYTNYIYAEYFETPIEVIKYLKQLEEIDNQVPNIFDLLGYTYNYLLQYDKAIIALERAQEIYDKWNSKPWWVLNYSTLGLAYHKTGKYKKEKELYKKAQQDFPDDPAIIYRQAILSLSEGDTLAANRYISKYISILKVSSAPDAEITTYLASIYSEAGILYKAEENYRLALSMEPESPEGLYNLAFFLIDKDRNINEGLELVNKVLELEPDNYSYIDCKGWGLFMQGKYKEALQLLEKSWDLKPVYIHQIYLHIQEAKKALSDIK
jgi:tetratricopeptide (TPR) repeat protein